MSLVKVNNTLIDPSAVVYAMWDGKELIVAFTGGANIRFSADEAESVWAMLYKMEPGGWKDDESG